VVGTTELIGFGPSLQATSLGGCAHSSDRRCTSQTTWIVRAQAADGSSQSRSKSSSAACVANYDVVKLLIMRSVIRRFASRADLEPKMKAKPKQLVPFGTEAYEPQ
jgi:hypothetical protein